MVSFTVASVFGLAAIAAAQTTALPKSSTQSCDSAYTVCISSYTSVETCKTQQATCEATCATKRSTCQSGASANEATCAAEESSCLGHLADAAANTKSSSSSSSASSTTTTVSTVVVDSYVTVCPYATSFTAGGKVYVATSATTITVACPCTLTNGALVTSTATSAASSSKLATTTAAVVTTSSATKSNVTSTYSPTKYTGGASVLGAGLGAVAGAAGLLAFAL